MVSAPSEPLLASPGMVLEIVTYTVGTICILVYEASFANTVIQDGGLRELIRCHEKDYLGN